MPQRAPRHPDVNESLFIIIGRANLAKPVIMKTVKGGPHLEGLLFNLRNRNKFPNSTSKLHLGEDLVPFYEFLDGLPARDPTHDSIVPKGNLASSVVTLNIKNDITSHGRGPVLEHRFDDSGLHCFKRSHLFRFL